MHAFGASSAAEFLEEKKGIREVNDNVFVIDVGRGVGHTPYAIVSWVSVGKAFGSSLAKELINRGAMTA